MTEKSNDQLATMMANLEEKTGKSMAEWVAIGQQSGHEKHRALLNYLKSEHGLTHGFANMVALQTLDANKGGPASDDDLVVNQYADAKAGLKPIYDALIEAINAFGDDVELAPKKAYVSLRRKKQFGLIQPSTKTRVDVGINLKGTEAGERLEASGSFNSMVSHRVRLSDIGDVDDELVGWLRDAYEAAE